MIESQAVIVISELESGKLEVNMIGDGNAKKIATGMMGICEAIKAQSEDHWERKVRGESND